MSNSFNKFHKGYNSDSQNFNGNVKNTDYFTSEFEINDTPVGARNLLTKGFIQDEINQCSGAAISTRGRYISKNDHMKNTSDRPLYLFIQGPTKQSIELAIQKIHSIIRTDIGNLSRPNFNVLQGNRPGSLSIQPVAKHPPPLMGPADSLGQVEKLFVGLDGLPAAFDLRGKIIGQGGSNLHYIRLETGAAVTLRGRGSQFLDPALGRESSEPLHLCIEHPRPEGLAAARQLAVNLVETLMQEIQQNLPEIQQQGIVPHQGQQTQNLPPRIINGPPLSVPPPQQQFTSISILQQQQHTLEQPLMMGNDQIHSLQNQVQQMNTQHMQQAQQMVQQQQQQIILQQPPPLARPPIVNIPPPGVHIPQHPGPLVPPPQLVQLSGPPPTAGGNVLVVGPPPNQPQIYLPPELVASSSSIGTFSLLQGGVLYHQAPPTQTQAHIGDDLHIISTPSQQQITENVNISINSHTQPPPQMIITQVQLDPNNQMVSQATDQVAHNFQQPIVSQQQQRTQYVLGHVQSQINQDQTQPIIQQNQELHSIDNFTHFNINNQTATSSSMVMTIPYHLNVTGNNANIATIAVTQNDGQTQLQQINTTNQSFQIQHSSEQENLMKQPPRQILQGSMLAQQQRPQCTDRGQINVQLLTNNQMHTTQPNAQAMFGPMITNQTVNNQGILNQIPTSQMPPNQIIQDQIPPMQTNNQQLSLPNNQQLQSHQPNQLMPPQQDLNIGSNKQQLSQMPPNQFHINQNQLNQQIQNQQVNRLQNQQSPNQQNFNQQPFNHNYDQPRQDSRKQGRDRPLAGRNRRTSRNSRQNNPHPWSKSDQDKKYPHSDLIWMKRDGDRNPDYERKNDDYTRNSDNRLRFQQNYDSSKPQSDDNRLNPQYRSNQDGDRNQFDNDQSKSASQSPSTQGNQRTFQQYEQSDSKTMQSDWNRTDNPESPDACRKRRFDEVPWNKKFENHQKTSIDVPKIHKNRFDQDYSTAGTGSQSANNSGSNPTLKNESPKNDKTASSKWSDKSDEPLSNNENSDIRKNEEIKTNTGQKSEPPPNGASGPAVTRAEATAKQSEKSCDVTVPNHLLSKKPTPWSDQRATFKNNNIQESNSNQFPIQNYGADNNSNDRHYNSNNQQNYMNTAQIFQGNLPYLLPPPPPPPLTQPHHNLQQQHSMQFSMAQASLPSSSAPLVMGTSSLQQSMPMPNMSQSMATMTTQLQPNMPIPTSQNFANIHQTVSYDNMINGMGQHNQNLATGIPAGMGQNSMGQNIQANMGQNNSLGMGQMIPTSIQPTMGHAMPMNMGQNMMPSIGQNINPYMAQNMPTSVSQTISHQMGQTMMAQNPVSMTQTMPPTMAQNVPPLMAQHSNMGHALTSMMGTNSPNMAQNMSNMNQNIPITMQSMGQLPLNMVPSMVPPPNIHGNPPQNIPNMVPPPMLPPNMGSRPHMGHHSMQQGLTAPPPPPPPSLHNMPTQPHYPYWVGQ